MFDREQRAEIRALCHEEMRLIHRRNRTRGTYRYLCWVAGQPIYSHTPRGEIACDFDEEPNL
jgi:hypothetical protein